MSTSTSVLPRFCFAVVFSAAAYAAPLPVDALNLAGEGAAPAVTVPISAEAFQLAGAEAIAAGSVDLDNAQDYMPPSPEPFRTEIAGINLGGMEVEEVRRWLEGGFISGRVFSFPVIPAGLVLLLAMGGAAAMLWSVGENQPGAPLPPYPRPGRF